MFARLREDIRTIFEKDPAAKNVVEVLLTYPGLHALLMYRVSHFFSGHRVPVLPRLLSHFARVTTGIEIHPGARIGRRFFIDHGMGVVIGETAEVGDDVLLYQGVTLGGTGLYKGKRHPTLGNNVVVGTGAQVLGNITIGDNVKIGANSVVLKSVPPDTTVVGVPGRAVVRLGDGSSRTDVLEHGKLPDPEREALHCLMVKVRELEERLDTIAPAAGPAVSAADRQDGKTDEFCWEEIFSGGSGI